MKKRIEVRTQAELDACVKDGNIAIVMGDARVEARESSHVEAWGSSHVVARGSSHVEAWESSHVEAWGSSHVVARGNVFVRLFAAAAIIASAHVVVMIHGTAIKLEGGIHIQAMTPVIGSEWCEYFGLDPATSNLRIPNIDAAILASIEANKAAGKNGLDMGSWHGTDGIDETNWCNTTHCRAGYAICLAGKAGFELEKKTNSEVAGQMIYAVSRLEEPLPDFHATNIEAMADIKAHAAKQTAVVP